jgi:hypothetical protein
MGKIPEEERRRTCWAKARVSACERIACKLLKTW